MKKTISIFLFAIALFPSISFGCDCIPSTSFCEDMTNFNGDFLPDLIFRGKVIGGSSTEKEIKVNEVIFGKTNQSRITIENLWICDLSFDEFEDGEEYIIALSEYSGELIPFLCGIYFLKIENEVVKGKIAPGIESIPYEDLGNLKDCNSAFENIDFKNTVSIFPNPTGGDVKIKNLSSENQLENLQVEIFDVLGRKITAFENADAILPEEIWYVNIEKFAPGVYFFKLLGNEREGFFKIVKQ